jgi:hypothetical protein
MTAALTRPPVLAATGPVAGVIVRAGVTRAPAEGW